MEVDVGAEELIEVANLLAIFVEDDGRLTAIGSRDDRAQRH